LFSAIQRPILSGLDAVDVQVAGPGCGRCGRPVRTTPSYRRDGPPDPTGRPGPRWGIPGATVLAALLRPSALRRSRNSDWPSAAMGRKH